MSELSFSHINVAYPSGDSSVCALDDFDLTVASGSSVSVIGPSGCGKSTMLNLAAGLLKPTGGAVSLDGNEVVAPSQSTALILQDFGLLPWKSVLQNAALGLTIRHMPRQRREDRAHAALHQVGLDGFEDVYPSSLSGGMRQRLALARSLALDSSLVLMDEPLSALDALLREELQSLLLSTWQREKYTQVLVTHSIDEAVFLGQRIVVMAPRPGRVAAVIDNPAMGSDEFRKTQEFFDQCRMVRALLDKVISENATAAERVGDTHE